MEKSNALIEKKIVEVNKMLHYINTNSDKCSEEEREYYCGMLKALHWVSGISKELFGYCGEIL